MKNRLIVLMFAIVTAVLSGVRSYAVEFATDPEQKTYEVSVHKATVHPIYPGREDYLAYDRNGTRRFALYSSGRIASIPVYFYDVHDAKGTLIYKSELFEIGSVDFTGIASRLEAVNRGCTTNLVFHARSHVLMKVKYSCAKKK